MGVGMGIYGFCICLYCHKYEMLLLFKIFWQFVPYVHRTLRLHKGHIMDTTWTPGQLIA